jgi:hypothetical protein
MLNFVFVVNMLMAELQLVENGSHRINARQARLTTE